MFRPVVIAGAAAVIATAAHAQEAAPQGSSNPLAVTWNVDVPMRFEPPIASFGENARSAPNGILFRMPESASNPLPTAAPGAWSADSSHFRSCDADEACGDISSNLGLRIKSGSSGVRLGALVRLGENLFEGGDVEDSSWRFFAAADAHALTWAFDRQADGDDVRVESKKLVGDAQVGIARSVAGGDLAFGFVHREVSYEDWSRDEQFGGVTFVLTR